MAGSIPGIDPKSSKIDHCSFGNQWFGTQIDQWWFKNANAISLETVGFQTTKSSLTSSKTCQGNRYHAHLQWSSLLSPIWPARDAMDAMVNFQQTSRFAEFISSSVHQKSEIPMEFPKKPPDWPLKAVSGSRWAPGWPYHRSAKPGQLEMWKKNHTRFLWKFCNHHLFPSKLAISGDADDENLVGDGCSHWFCVWMFIQIPKDLPKIFHVCPIAPCSNRRGLLTTQVGVLRNGCGRSWEATLPLFGDGWNPSRIKVVMTWRWF